MSSKRRPDDHPTKPVVDAYMASLPKAISDQALETLLAFHEYAMRMAGEFLDESMHEIVYDFLRTLGRQPSAAVGYLMQTPRGGGMLLCGATSDPEVNATTQPAGDGYVILITDRLLVLMNELARVHTAVTRFGADDGTVMEPVMSFGQVQDRINQIIAWVQGGEPFPPTSPWDFDEDRSHFAEVIYDEIVAFTLAHELAHILLGHFEQRVNEFREFAQAVPGATANGIRTLDELDADALATRLCARRTAQLGRGTYYLGALFFFQINYMLEVAASTRRNESARQAVRRMQARARASHPYPLRRLDLAIRSGVEDPSGPMELCDGALTTFDVIWHGPAPARSAAALDNLERRAAGLGPEPLNAIFGFKEQGMRKLVPNDVRELLERDGEEGAAAWVSFTALSYLAQVGHQRRCVSGEEQLRLCTIFGAFHAHYLNVRHPSQQAVALDADVRAAIPELGMILDTYAQVIG
jgi:hypothetical protein